ncbi:ThiJ/PfpI family protein [Paraphaeosphaeria sporulosa]
MATGGCIGAHVTVLCNRSMAIQLMRTENAYYTLCQSAAEQEAPEAEEDAYNFTSAMPFLLEDEMKNQGGKYEKADQLFEVKVVVSGEYGKLITGQNPPSACVTGKTILEVIQKS